MDGTTSKDYQQFDTVKAIRTIHQHMYESGPLNTNCVFKTTGENSKTLIVRTSHCPTDYLFSTRFSHGCLARMGKEIKSDMALDPVTLHWILNNLNNEWINTGTPQQC